MGPPMSRPGSLGEDDGFRPVLVLDLVEALFDGVQSLVPGDALERALAALPHPLHGVSEALGMIDVLGEGQSPRAEAALVVGVVFVALHLDQPAVLDIELEAATPMAAGPGDQAVDLTSARDNATSFLRGGQKTAIEEG